ncbi:hypothetical protein LSH36_60g09012 [Paralvinella palmiformis]|uniref:Osteoclast-stimulating factor 1 n=1 Tax=Paralvinella palmiformis TaxID=53620 RepID=A0AAD9K4P3_9ANNE|nr:hypothetical protein LSH36_60g09012 [Paralvinella palmiformis]
MSKPAPTRPAPPRPTPKPGADLKARICKARGAFIQLKNIWSSKVLLLHTKIRLFNSNVKSVLLYGAGTWRTTNTTKKLQTFINKCLRRILQIRWPYTISNSDLWEKTHQRNAGDEIRRRQWGWIGHTLRKPASTITRQALTWNPQGKRKRGRPKNTWRRDLMTDIKRTGYSWRETDELSFDEGDMLYITDMSDSDWWKARCCGRTGLIPSNYVEESTESIDNPLHEAAKRGNIIFLRECISNNVSVNSLDKAGSTPIHWAAHGGHIDCMKALMEVPKCEINVQNKLGDTALHSAAWKGHPEAVELLLSRGADAFVRNNDNKTPLDLAKEPQTAALLQQVIRPVQLYSEDYGNEDDSD